MLDEFGDIQHFRELLAGHGLQLEGSNYFTREDGLEFADLRISFGKLSEHFNAMWVPKATPRSIFSVLSQSGRLNRPLILTSKMNADTADALASAGVAFIDWSGNMRLQFSTVLVDVRGRRVAKSQPSLDDNSELTSTQPYNLFSVRSSQVLFALLSWPALMNAPQRELARVSRTSLGHVHKTLSALEDSGFAYRDTRGRAFSGAERLFELWVAAFPLQLARSLELKTYSSERTQLSTPPGYEVVLSGENAVPHLVHASTLTLYVDEIAPELAMMNRWRSDREPNVTVRRRFWDWPTPDEVPQRGMAAHFAPPVLIYADLLAVNDPRLDQAAADFRAHDPRLQQLSRG